MVVNRRLNCKLCTATAIATWDSERSALQTLHKISSKARQANYFQGGQTHEWVNYYEERVESDRSCLNEWHAMDSLESRRPPSPDSVRTKPRERDEAELVIRSTLKEIMMSVDLDEVTSKYIRNRLEEDLNMNLGEYKSFIDQEMLTILGQMDAPTEIFEHVYLGSEWNASNFEELQKNGVGHILNVTREIDNFFPGMFDYLNVRVYDDEKTDLLKYWDNTFKYITKAKKEGSKVLVHCKMGVSRSASVVVAYAMKAYDWDLERALKHVKQKRNCIKPNASFIAQLETYQGILDAMKNKEKLQRSKSETNLKRSEGGKSRPETTKQRGGTQTPSREIRRPKSWSPGGAAAERATVPTTFLSLENLSCSKRLQQQQQDQQQQQKQRQQQQQQQQQQDMPRSNVLMPFQNGQSYSVSPNQIVHIPGGGGAPSDPFSNRLDRVFDREERSRRCPSRQASWSSCDSAVVLHESRDAPSRHSSWGSGDTRTLPSRNSSWGSYDMRAPDRDRDGTVRRTRQKLEGDTTTTTLGPLSASAPDCAVSADRGVVRTLRREFEARTATAGGDVCVRELVGRYESGDDLRSRCIFEGALFPTARPRSRKTHRYSCIEVGDKLLLDASSVKATVVKAAACKLRQANAANNNNNNTV